MKNIFLIVLFAAVLGCSEKAEKPKDLISSDEMALILVDIHKLEAKLANLRVSNDSMRKVYNTFEREMLVEHGTNREAYSRSYEYYISQPKLMEEIYEVVVDSLNVSEQQASMELNKEMESKPKKRSAKNSSTYINKKDLKKNNSVRPEEENKEED